MLEAALIERLNDDTYPKEALFLLRGDNGNESGTSIANFIRDIVGLADVRGFCPHTGRRRSHLKRPVARRSADDLNGYC
jgi:hypothetical protein